MLEPCGTQLLGYAVEHYELRGILSLICLSLGWWRCWLSCSVHHSIVFKDFLHFLVAETAVALYHAVMEPPAQHLSLFVHVEYHAVCELLLVGAQRTDEVAESLRQHRYGAVYEVYTCGSLHCLLVDYRPLGDVMRHVSDMYSYFP